MKTLKISLAILVALTIVSCSSERHGHFTKIKVNKNETTVAVKKSSANEISGLTASISANTELQLNTGSQISLLSNPKAPVLIVNNVNHGSKASVNSAALGSKISKFDAISLVLKNQKSIVKATKTIPAKTMGGDDQIIALILAVLLGGLGIHRFYLGYTWQGVVQLLTGGGCGIWALIDLIRIITGDLKPKDGRYNRTL